MKTLLIKNGLLVNSNGVRKKDILCEGKKIIKIANKIDESANVEIDAKGLCILPGIIDAHTHYHLVSRGTVTADSFEEGSRSAAYGGVTTVIDFVDHHKGKTITQEAQDRINEMSENMAIDFALHQSICRNYDGLDQDLEELKNIGIHTVKLYTTYKKAGFYISDEDHDEVFNLCKKHKIMITVHCEDDNLIEETAKKYKGDFLPKDHPDLRPSDAEALAITYICDLALKHEMPVYVVHLSSSKGLQAVREARAKGCNVRVESTPHYMRLTRDLLLGDKAPLYVMTPPLRTQEDNIDLCDALENEEIQVMATDHCSFTYAQKLESHDIRTLYPGIPGSEDLLLNVWTLEDKVGNDLTQVVKVLCEGPSMEFGIDSKKGYLKEGYDADIVIFDPYTSTVLSNEKTHSASNYTPYDGFKVKGRVVTTIKSGKVIVDEDGKYYGEKGKGKFLKAKKPYCYR